MADNKKSITRIAGAFGATPRPTPTPTYYTFPMPLDPNATPTPMQSKLPIPGDPMNAFAKVAAQPTPNKVETKKEKKGTAKSKAGKIPDAPVPGQTNRLFSAHEARATPEQVKAATKYAPTPGAEKLGTADPRGIYALTDTSTQDTTSSSQSSTTNTPAMQSDAERAVSNVNAQIEEGKTQKKEIGEKYPEYSSPANMIRQREGVATRQKEDLVQALHDRTAGMDDAQEALFWQKIIAGIGRAAAGITGLATDLNVGGAYKEPEMLTQQELTAPVTTQYAARKEQIGDEAEGQTSLLNAVQKIIDGTELKPKEYTDLLRAINANRAGNVAQTGAKEEAKQGSTTNINIAPPTTAGENPKKGKEKVEQVPVYDFVPYATASSGALQNFNTFYRQVPAEADSAKFAMAMTNAVKTRSGKGAAMTPNPTQIAQLHAAALKKAGGDPVRAKETIGAMFQSAGKPNLKDFDNYDAFVDAANAFGFNPAIIKIDYRDKPSGGSASAPRPGKVPAYPAGKQPQAAAPQAQPQGDMVIIRYTDPKTGKIEDVPQTKEIWEAFKKKKMATPQGQRELLNFKPVRK